MKNFIFTKHYLFIFFTTTLSACSLQPYSDTISVNVDSEKPSYDFPFPIDPTMQLGPPTSSSSIGCYFVLGMGKGIQNVEPNSSRVINFDALTNGDYCQTYPGAGSQVTSSLSAEFSLAVPMDKTTFVAVGATSKTGQGCPVGQNAISYMLSLGTNVSSNYDFFPLTNLKTTEN